MPDVLIILNDYIYLVKHIIRSRKRIGQSTFESRLLYCWGFASQLLQSIKYNSDSFFFLFILRSRDLLVLHVFLNQFLTGGLPAVLSSLRWSSGCSFPYWFPFKCDAWQSSLFYSSHVSVPISFSLSAPSYDVLHSTLFLIRSILVFPIIVLSVFISATRNILFVLLVSFLVWRMSLLAWYKSYRSWPRYPFACIRSPILSALSSPTWQTLCWSGF